MKIYIVIFLCLILVNFFGATSFGNTVSLGIMLPFVFLDIKNPSLFRNNIIFVAVGLFLSMISSELFRDQSLFTTFRVSASYLYIIFYFVLRRIDISVTNMEYALEILVLVFCICYILQYIYYPRVIFSGAEQDYTEDIRIRLYGQGLSSLGYFFGLNRFLQNKKYLYLALSFLCLFVIILMGFRTMIVLIVVFTFVLTIKINGFNKRLFTYCFLSIIALFFIIQIPIVSEKIDFMLDRQETAVLTNEDYIRVIQFQYFTQEHFKNIWEYIFGSGVPDLAANSSYSIYMNGLLDRGITWVDFGLLSISWLIGIPTVIAMIVYAIKAVFIKVPVRLYYVGVWFAYLLLSSFTTAEFFRPGNFIIQAFALYILERGHNIYIRRERESKYEKNRHFNIQ